jgi:hypothetical protein
VLRTIEESMLFIARPLGCFTSSLRSICGRLASARDQGTASRLQRKLRSLPIGRDEWLFSSALTKAPSLRGIPDASTVVRSQSGRDTSGVLKVSSERRFRWCCTSATYPSLGPTHLGCPVLREREPSFARVYAVRVPLRGCAAATSICRCVVRTDKTKSKAYNAHSDVVAWWLRLKPPSGGPEGA